MEEKTYKQSFALLGQGTMMLLTCIFKNVKKSTRDAAKDLAFGIVHHPLVTIVMVGIIAFQTYTIINQRVERDKLSKQLYKTEVSRDSAMVFCEDTVNFKQYYANEHRSN